MQHRHSICVDNERLAAIARRRWRCARVAIIIASLVIGVEVARVAAQDGGLNDRGLHLNRDYFSQFPFEHIDAATGALVLTFTDLVLPGPKGRDLRFQRTYNSKDHKWTFGLAGYALYIYEPGFPPKGGSPDGYSPTLYTADGGEHRTTSMQPVDMTDESTIANSYWATTTDRFWRVHRTLGGAEDGEWVGMLNGTTCWYEEDGSKLMRLTRCYAPDGVQEFSIDWESSTITQTMLGQERRVTLTFMGEGRWRLPTELTFAGRTWRYEWSEALARAIPPAGPAWEISSSSNLAPRTMIVKTPHGGQVGYEIENLEFPGRETPDVHNVHSLVVTKRWTLDRGASERAEWLYDYQNEDYYAPVIMRTPTGAEIGSQPEPGTSLLRVRTVWDLVGGALVQLEKEERTYADWPVVNYYFANGTVQGPGLTAKVITNAEIARNGLKHRTEYAYAPTNYGDYHHPKTITETGTLGTRVTEREYSSMDFASPPGVPSGWLSAGRVKRESVSVNGETFVNSWNVNPWDALHDQTLLGVTTMFTAFNGHAQPVRAVDANGHVTTLQYSWGVQSGRLGPEPGGWTREIHEDGTITSETHGVGTRNERKTTYRYDAAFRVIEIQPPQTSGSRMSTKIDYDNVGGTWMRTTRDGISVTTTLDGFGRPIEQRSSDGTVVTTRYDAEGRVVFEGYPVAVGAQAIGTSIEYDALGRVTKRTSPDGSFSTFIYGVETVTVTDEKGRVTVRRVQAFGDPDDTRLVGLTDATGVTWTYKCNALGKLTEVAAPDGTKRLWTYQPTTSWPTTETHPESGTTTYSYAGDAVGNVTSTTDAKNQLVAFEYDTNNRLKKITAGGEVTTIAYESGSDNREHLVTGPVDISYGYDAAGHATAIRTVIGGEVFDTRFELDKNDNLRVIVYPSRRRVRIEVDAENRVTQVRDVLSGTIYASNITYHPSGALASYTAGNGVVHQFAYDPTRYWPTQIQSGPLHLTYSNYDAVGNVGVIGDGRGAGFNQTLGYDLLDRLTQSTGVYGQLSYAYDAHGNMTTHGGDTMAYNSTTLRLTSRNGQAFSYDATGNMTGDVQGTYTYDAHNQMRTATVGTATTSYDYDADQWRVRKVSGSTTTYYLRDPNGRVLTEMTVEGATPPKFRDYIYAGSRLLAVVEQ